MSSDTTLPEEFEARVAALQQAGIRLMDLADSRDWPGGIPWRIVLRKNYHTGRGQGHTISEALAAAEIALARTLSHAPAELPSLDDLEL